MTLQPRSQPLCLCSGCQLPVGMQAHCTVERHPHTLVESEKMSVSFFFLFVSFYRSKLTVFPGVDSTDAGWGIATRIGHRETIRQTLARIGRGDALGRNVAIVDQVHADYGR